MEASNCMLPVDKLQSVIKCHFFWYTAPLIHSLARCLWKHLLIFGVLLRMVGKTLSRPLWIFSCGCEHWLWTLCSWGVRHSAKGPVSLQSPAFVGLFILSLPTPPLLERVNLIQELWLPLQFSACIRHALKSLFLSGWSLNPTYFFSGKRTY